MVAYFTPILFLLAIVNSLLGVDPPGSGADPSFSETLLLWTLYLSFGWAGIGAGISHTIFARKTAKAIGWETNGFQYEVGFSDFSRGVAAIYAVHSASEGAWIAVTIAGGLFAVLAGVNHIRGIVKEKNFAPGNTVILLSNFGPPIVALITLSSVGAI